MGMNRWQIHRSLHANVNGSRSDLTVKRLREPSSDANGVTRLRGAPFAVILCTIPRPVTPAVNGDREPSTDADFATCPHGAKSAMLRRNP